MGDLATLQWIVGLAVAALGAIIGHTHARINRLEAAHQQTSRDLADLERRILTTVATKSDLREMEDRIMAALREGL